MHYPSIPGKPGFLWCRASLNLACPSSKEIDNRSQKVSKLNNEHSDQSLPLASKSSPRYFQNCPFPSPS